MAEEKVTFAQRIADELMTENVNFVPFEQLTEGWHDVKVSLAIVTDDVHAGLRNPKPKDEAQRPGWMDPTPQIGVYFQTDTNHGCARRFSLLGYKNFDALLKADPAEAKACEPMGDSRYAVDKNDKVRLIDPENTRLARLIVKRMCTAAALKEGIKGSEIPQNLIGKTLKIQVGSHMYNGKKYYDVVNFAPVDTPAEDLNRIPTPTGVMTALPATDEAEV
jgi:hypothetical protein